jgi:hypothetical protein
MRFQVMIPVKPRLNASMYEIVTAAKLTVGFEFESTVSQLVRETINGTPMDIHFVKMADGGYWVPLVYMGDEYVKMIDGEMPPVQIAAKPIMASAEVTSDNQVIVQVTDPNDFPVRVFVRGVEWFPPS